MKRPLVWSALIVCAVLVATSLGADVKTTDKSTFKLEGMLGMVMNRMAGGAEGITSSVAVKGNRMSRMNSANGQGEIVDLSEEKVYTVDTKKKEYSVVTFAQMREAMEKLRAEMAEKQKQMKPQDQPPAQDPGKEVEFDVDVKATGQTKAISGYDAKENVITVTMREKGKKLEESGGMVVTRTLWLAPRVAALDEVTQFRIKFFKAVYAGVLTGTDTGMDAQQLTSVFAMFPALVPLMEKLQTEGRKLQGTSLSSTIVIEGVKSAEQMAVAPAKSGGGGVGGMLASKIMRGGPAQQRTTVMTIGHDTLSIATAAAAEDVAIPAGFKELKK